MSCGSNRAWARMMLQNKEICGCSILPNIMLKSKRGCTWCWNWKAGQMVDVGIWHSSPHMQLWRTGCNHSNNNCGTQTYCFNLKDKKTLLDMSGAWLLLCQTELCTILLYSVVFYLPCFVKLLTQNNWIYKNNLLCLKKILCIIWHWYLHNHTNKPLPFLLEAVLYITNWYKLTDGFSEAWTVAYIDAAHLINANGTVSTQLTH